MAMFIARLKVLLRWQVSKFGTKPTQRGYPVGQRNDSHLRSRRQGPSPSPR